MRVQYLKRRNASVSMESAVSNIITVTDKAVSKLTELKGDQQKMLRIQVVFGGCSGNKYKLGWDDYKEGDHMINLDTVTILIDHKSSTYMAGTNLDYADGLDGTGFVFSNPNAVKSCHCGTSFSCG
jgi:iron-sulfur cluster assembly protein